MRKAHYVISRIPDPTKDAGSRRVLDITDILKQYFEVSFLLTSDKYSKAQLEIATKELGISCYSSEESEHMLRRGLKTVIFDNHYQAYKNIKNMPRIANSITHVHDLWHIKLKRLITYLKKYEDTVLMEEEHYVKIKQLEMSAYKWSDMLITLSEYEQNVLKHIFPNKKIINIPTYIEKKPKSQIGFEDRKNIVFLGYFSKTGYCPNRLGIEYFIKNIFPKVLDKSPGIKLVIIGHGSENLNYNDPDVIIKGKIPDINEELQKYRVFVCPLIFGAGMKKKMLDAAMAGIPIVSTAVGAEGTRFIAKKDLFVEDDPLKFAERIIQLYNKKNCWNDMAMNAYSKTLKEYTAAEINTYAEHINSFVQERETSSVITRTDKRDKE